MPPRPTPSRRSGHVKLTTPGTAALFVVLAAVLLAAPAAPLCGQIGNNPLLPPDRQTKVKPSIPEEEGEREEAAAAPSKLNLHVLGLIQDEDVTAPVAEDAIWSVRPGPGRYLMQVPVVLTPGDTPYELTTSTLKLAGARLLVWRLIERAEKAPEGSDAYKEIQANLPADAPYLTRRVTITPQGRMQWKLERVIPGATLRGGETLYGMKLNPQLLAQKNPGPLPTIRQNPGEELRSYYARRQAQIADYQSKMIAFRDLRKKVMDLPDEFDMPLPPRIWAVFEVRANTRDLTSSGWEAGPWALTSDQLQSIRGVLPGLKLAADAGGPRNPGGPALPENVSRHVQGVYAMVTANPHEYSLRCASYLVTLGRLPRLAQPNDSVFDLCQTILKSKDAVSRRIVVKELVSTFPPTQATTMLLSLAAADMDPSAKLLSLKNMLRSQVASPEQLREMVTAANRLLADPQGPSAAEVIEQLLGDSNLPAEVANVLTQQIRFVNLPAARRDAMISAVIERATTNPLAAVWLDQQLLGSTDAATVRRTLEILASAEVGSQRLKPLVSAFVAMVFGPPRKDAAAPTAPKLLQPIVILSSRHNLFRVLQHGDAQVRALAWKTLPRFSFGPPQPQDDRYRLVSDVALSLQPTPPQIVEFLLKQPDVRLVAPELVRVVVTGSVDTAGLAAQRLVGSRLPLEAPLLALSFGDRHGFATRFYQSTRGAAPLVAGLFRQRSENKRLVGWFAAQVSAGAVPEPAQFATAVGGDELLIELIPSNDEDLALAATSALVAAAGGDERTARGLNAQMRALQDKTVPALTAYWQQARRNVYLSRITRMAGPYRAVINLFPPTPPTPPGRVPPVVAPEKTIPIGLVQLRVEAGAVKFGNLALTISVPNHKLAIRLDKPAELKLIPSEEITRLPLESVPGPLELVPDSTGAWRAPFTLPGGKRAELLLTPGN